MISSSFKLGVILVFGFIFWLFEYAEAWEGSFWNISFDFTAIKIIFSFVGITSTMMSIVLACICFDVEQKMESLFFCTASVASLMFWALLTGLVRL